MEKTIKNLLTTAMAPMGHVLYLYGGGWNLEDTGASEAAKTIGLSSSWIRFFEKQDLFYTYRDDENKEKSYYPYSGENRYSDLGLDCSGYLGWVLYNTLYDKNGEAGFVVSSTQFAKRLAELGWGCWTPKAERYAVLPGDIVSIKGHVWMCMGNCDDGSIVIAHSTPSKSRQGCPGGGVQLSALGESIECEAYDLAKRYMKTCCEAWYERYPVELKSFNDYMNFEAEDAGRFSWDLCGKDSRLTDPDGIREMTAGEIFELLLED